MVVFLAPKKRPIFRPVAAMKGQSSASGDSEKVPGAVVKAVGSDPKNMAEIHGFEVTN